jgi:hypothetical protein
MIGRSEMYRRIWWGDLTNVGVLVGVAIDIVVLVNPARSRWLKSDRRLPALMEARPGDTIREVFRLDPAALTAEEAQYLIGFRSADEIRNRSLAAKQETDRRLRAKGVDRMGSGAG